MQILRWGAAAALAAVVNVAPSAAGDDLAAMRASMDNMRAEMAMLAEQRAALRGAAGGAPAYLQSAKGNATVRIGGDVRTQYSISWNSGYNRTRHSGNGIGTNYRTTDAGWSMAKAKLFFDVDLAPDVQAHLAFDFANDPQDQIDGMSLIDELYFRVNNLGGAGLSVKAGIYDQPFGMANNVEFGGWDFHSSERAIITDPFAADFSTFIYKPNKEYFPINRKHDTTNAGISLIYNWHDEVYLQAGFMSSEIETDCRNGISEFGADPGSDRHNVQRNIGFINHVVTLAWNPFWLEGLHLEGAYKGVFDSACGAEISKYQRRNPYVQPKTPHGDEGYSPSFDLGFSYKFRDKFAVYGEASADICPDYINGVSVASTLGFEYKITRKFTLGGEFDWVHYRYNGAGNKGDDLYNNIYRFSMGARYGFENGLYVRCQLLHDFERVFGKGESGIRPSDAAILETGFTF